jgi:hypothetical protein
MRFPFLIFLTSALALGAPDQYQLANVGSGGVSATWIFANIAYTGMRAQANPSFFWSVVSFLGGFPGTLLTYFVVRRGSERAYGIDMPRKRRS